MIGLDHVAPKHVSADLWRCDAAQHTAHRGLLAPGCFSVLGILVVIGVGFCAPTDLYTSGIVWIAAGNRMVLEFTKVTCERNVLSPGDVLVPEEQHPVFQQQCID